MNPGSSGMPRTVYLWLDNRHTTEVTQPRQRCSACTNVQWSGTCCQQPACQNCRSVGFMFRFWYCRPLHTVHRPWLVFWRSRVCGGLLCVLLVWPNSYLLCCCCCRSSITAFKPNSITLASSELAPNMFGASSQLVRRWFEAEIWPIIQLASSELARASKFAAKFHYAS